MVEFVHGDAIMDTGGMEHGALGVINRAAPQDIIAASARKMQTHPSVCRAWAAL